MKPWGETEESSKHNQFPPNDTFGNQVCNLVITVLSLIGAFTIVALIGAEAAGTTCGCR